MNIHGFLHSIVFDVGVLTVAVVLTYLTYRLANKFKKILDNAGIGYYGKVNIEKLAYLRETSDKKITVTGLMFNHWGITIMRESKKLPSDFSRPAPITPDEYPSRLK